MSMRETGMYPFCGLEAQSEGPGAAGWSCLPMMWDQARSGSARKKDYLDYLDRGWVVGFHQVIDEQVGSKEVSK